MLSELKLRDTEEIINLSGPRSKTNPNMLAYNGKVKDYSSVIDYIKHNM